MLSGQMGYDATWIIWANLETLLCTMNSRCKGLDKWLKHISLPFDPLLGFCPSERKRNPLHNLYHYDHPSTANHFHYRIMHTTLNSIKLTAIVSQVLVKNVTSCQSTTYPDIIKTYAFKPLIIFQTNCQWITFKTRFAPNDDSVCNILHIFVLVGRPSWQAEEFPSGTSLCGCVWCWDSKVKKGWILG